MMNLSSIKYSLMLLVFFLCIFTSQDCIADAWTTQDVTGNVVAFYNHEYDCVAFDSTATTFVIASNPYRDLSRELTVLFWFENNKWQHEEIYDSTSVRIESSYILVDSSDTIHIFSIINHSGLQLISHLYGRPGQWSQESLMEYELPFIAQLNAACDSNNNLHLSFYCYDYSADIRTIYYLTNTSGSWQYELVTEVESSANKIVVTDNDTVYIASVTLDVFDNTQIECFSKPASTWQGQALPFSNLDDWFSVQSLAADSYNKLHSTILTTTGGYYNLAYATNASGSWLAESVDTIIEPNYIYISTQLVIDSNDQVHLMGTYANLYGIFYTDEDPDISIRHFMGNYGSWQHETVYTQDIDTSPSLGTWVIDGQDAIYMAGNINIEKTLDLLSGNWNNWQNQTIAYAGVTGNKSILTLNSSGQPQIAYQDHFFNKLRWANTDGATWEKDPNEAISVSLSDWSSAYGWCMRWDASWDAFIDSSDNRYLTYVDSEETHYGYATDANGYWQRKNWDYGDLPFQISIAAMSPQNVHIGAFGFREYFLGPYISTFWDITNTTGTWQKLYLENQQVSGINVTQIIRSDNIGTIHNAYIWKPYLGSLTYSGPHLKYAELVSGSWLTQIIDPNIGAAYKPDMGFFDTSNTVHISYFNESEYAIKYATNASGSWVLDAISTNGLLSGQTAIAVDSNGFPHIALIEDNDLKIAHYTDSSCSQWELVTVEEDVDEYASPSLEMDANDQYHISFYKGSEERILYATTAIDTPVISVEPEAFNLYKPKDSSGDEDFTILNDGSAALNISSMTFTGPDASKFSHSGFSTSLPPGGVCFTTITVDTSETGTFDSELEIRSDDPRNPILTVFLHAHVFDFYTSYLECKYKYPVVDFCDIELEHTSDIVNLRFTNTYSGQLTISGMSVLTDDPNNFPTNHFSFPFTLAPDGYFDVYISFAPQQLGRIDGTLIMAANPGENASIALTGVGLSIKVPNLTVTADNLNPSFAAKLKLMEF